MHSQAQKVQSASKIEKAQRWQELAPQRAGDTPGKNPDASDQEKPCAKSLWQLSKTTVTEWLAGHGPRLAAAFSYYAIFSIGPLLIITMTIVGLLFGQKAASDELRPQITNLIGEKAADFVQKMVTATAQSAHFSLVGFIAIILIIYAATNLFVSLQDALNSMFGVVPKPGRGIKDMLRDRTVSFLMVLAIGLFVLASIVLSTAITALGGKVPTANPTMTSILLQVANFVASSIIYTGIFALMFKYLPDVKIFWRDTLIGAAVTSVLFNLARIGLGIYLGRSSTAGPFGAAGSLVVIMLFIYYSSLMLFLGAKFTQVYACRNGERIRPSDNAVALHAWKPRKGPQSLPDKSLSPLPFNRRNPA